MTTREQSSEDTKKWYDLSDETVDSLFNFFRPKHGDIIEFDLNRNEYLCWITRLLYKYEAKKFKDKPVRPETRFVIGYTRHVWKPSPITGRCHDTLDYNIHYVGSEGVKSHIVSEVNLLDFLLLRRPFLGFVMLLALLGFAGIVFGIEFLKKKILRLKRAIKG